MLSAATYSTEFILHFDDLSAFNMKVIEEIADGKHLKAAS
jgi:hypothetical protein